MRARSCDIKLGLDLGVRLNMIVGGQNWGGLDLVESVGFGSISLLMAWSLALELKGLYVSHIRRQNVGDKSHILVFLLSNEKELKSRSL